MNVDNGISPSVFGAFDRSLSIDRFGIILWNIHASSIVTVIRVPTKSPVRLW